MRHSTHTGIKQSHQSGPNRTAGIRDYLLRLSRHKDNFCLIKGVENPVQTIYEVQRPQNLKCDAAGQRGSHKDYQIDPNCGLPAQTLGYGSDRSSRAGQQGMHKFAPLEPADLGRRRTPGRVDGRAVQSISEKTREL